MLEQLGLVSALTELTTTFGRVSGIRVERQFDHVAAEARARCRARRLPDRAGEPDQRRPPCAGEPSDRSRSSGASTASSCASSTTGAASAATPAEHGGLRSMRERALLVGRRAGDQAGAAEASRCASRFRPLRVAEPVGADLMPIPLVTRILIADDFRDRPLGAAEGARRQARPRGRRRGRGRRRSRREGAQRRTSTWQSSTSRCRA